MRWSGQPVAGPSIQPKGVSTGTLTRAEIDGEISSGQGLGKMLTMVAMAADALGRTLAEDFRRTFGSINLEHAERLDAISRVALECIGRSDALYHNVEHTLLVTLVGLDILHGRMLTERLEAEDYAHLIVACLLHDIGYVRGVVKGDGNIASSSMKRE